MQGKRNSRKALVVISMSNREFSGQRCWQSIRDSFVFKVQAELKAQEKLTLQEHLGLLRTVNAHYFSEL